MISLAVGGTENHVHILFHLPPSLALAKAVSLLKANSSKWMGEQGKDFSWQGGCGLYLEPAEIRIRSIQRQFIEPRSATRYIQNQEVHHRKTSFEDEFRALLPEHGVEYDPKYVLG